MHYEKHFCEIILNLGRWLNRRWCLKIILFLALAAILFSRAEQFVQFCLRPLWETFLRKYFENGPVVKEMLLKVISTLGSGGHFVRKKHNCLCSFGRGHYWVHSWGVILNLDQSFRCCLKIFLVLSSGGYFVQQSGTICAIMVEGIMGNNQVKWFYIWTSDSGDVILILFLALVFILFSSRVGPFVLFW